MEFNKQYAMQNVRIAIRLDDEGNSAGAYRKYLECIEFMTHQLSLDATQYPDAHATDSVQKYIALCRQCLDRVEDIAKSSPPAGNVKSEVGPQGQNSPSVDLSLGVVSNNQSTIWPLTSPTPRTTKVLSPVELAQQQNDYLIARHKARIERMAPNNQTTANLSLSLQRRLMENMAIAKQRQLVLEKKKEERLKRLQEEADRRFRWRTGMSPDELARRKLYTEILEYEQDEKWLLELRKKVPEKCKDSSFIIDCVHGIIYDSDHPLSQLLKTYQYHVGQTARRVANMFASQKETNLFFDSKDNGCTFSTEKSQSISQSPGSVVKAADYTPKSSGNRNNESFSTKTASDQAISSLVAEVQSYLENLETMFVVTYEEFDDEEVRNIVRDLVEDYFFQPVWPHILALFRHSTYAKEQTMIEVMNCNRGSSPRDIGVSEKFCLCRDLSSDPVLSGLPPYNAVVQSFQSVVHITTPSKKLDQLVHSSQLICQCIDEFYSNLDSSSPHMGADEMLPVLSYVILKTEQPMLVGDCFALMEFIDEGSLMGERGYCLTSVMTAMDFLLSLSSSTSPETKP